MNESWHTTNGDRVEVFKRFILRGALRSRAAGSTWHWHVRAANSEIVEHGEGYSRRIDAVEAAERHHPRIEAGQ